MILNRSKNKKTVKHKHHGFFSKPTLATKLTLKPLGFCFVCINIFILQHIRRSEFTFPSFDSRPRHTRKTTEVPRHISNPALGRLHKHVAISEKPVVTECYAGSDQMMSVQGGLTHTRDRDNAADIMTMATAGGGERHEAQAGWQ